MIYAAGAVWSAARAIKASIALRSGEPYTFSSWEGAWSAGKTLTRRGVWAILVLSPLLAIVLIGLVSGVVPFGPAKFTSVGLLAVSAVCDLIFRAPRSNGEV